MTKIIEQEKELSFLKKIDFNEKVPFYKNFSFENLDDNLSEITLFHINEITFEEKEKNPRREAFENVLGAIREEGVNFIYLILGDKKGISFYFGVTKELKENKELNMPIVEMGDILLKTSIQGNFRGSKIKKLTPQENREILKKLKESKRFGTVAGIPGINESNDKSNFQGVDRLIDVMLGDEFGLCIIAKPINDLKILELEEQLYNLYDNLNLYSKRSIQSGVNDSNSKGTSTSISSSKTEGQNSSFSKNESQSESTSTGKNTNISSSTGTSISKATGTNYSKNTSKNESNTSGESDSSGSSGTSSSTSKGITFGDSSGESKTSTEGKSTNESKSWGKNESQSKSETSGTSTSEGSSSSETEGKTQSENENKTLGTSFNISTEILNKRIQDWLKYFDEILFPMIDYGKSKGLYLTNSFIFSNNNGTIIKLGNTMKSLFSGRKGNKMPLRLEILNHDDERIEYFKNFQIPEYNLLDFNNEDKKALTLKSSLFNDEKIETGNWYSANELSLIAGLPQKEVVGLSLKEETEFGLNVEKNKDSDNIILGNLIQSGNELNIEVALEKSALNKHVFVTGVTGTGKTTTCQKLLLESKMPFLVIEPAKTEYRILIDKEETKDILIFTLGKDTVAPFRLNPFEFFPHESITSRVDMLKASIESSFEMEAAIPQLIESAMYECYKDYGWDIATNENYKFENPFEKGVYSFPTLKDLIDKVEEEVIKQGFDDKLKKDYIGSIKARLQGLLIGSKGLMLNVGRGIDFRELIDKKVVLEIEEIKNGGEKSLIMGFVLTNLVEALKAKYREKRDFRHITLIEEAHRLLAKYSPGDSPNKKQGIETFTDMLAEVRKYGECLVIADQIPNKLTPEILKNTNTKIVHKIFAEDDKEAIGNTMSLSNEQKKFLSSLSVGRAVVFSQGWEKALQVQIKQGTNTTGDRYVEDWELKNRIIDFYRERYKENIFYGTKFAENILSKEDFIKIRQCFYEIQNIKIFENVFEATGKIPFNEILFIGEFLSDRKIWDIYKKIVNKISDIKELDYFINKIRNFILKYSLEKLLNIIFYKYFSHVLSNKKNDIYEVNTKIINNIISLETETIKDILKEIDIQEINFLKTNLK